MRRSTSFARVLATTLRQPKRSLVLADDTLSVGDVWFPLAKRAHRLLRAALTRRLSTLYSLIQHGRFAQHFPQQVKQVQTDAKIRKLVGNFARTGNWETLMRALSRMLANVLAKDFADRQVDRAIRTADDLKNYAAGRIDQVGPEMFGALLAQAVDMGWTLPGQQAVEQAVKRYLSAAFKPDTNLYVTLRNYIRQKRFRR